MNRGYNIFEINLARKWPDIEAGKEVSLRYNRWMMDVRILLRRSYLHRRNCRMGLIWEF